MNLLQVGKLTEQEARKEIERIRWPEGAVCPHCGCTGKAYELNGEATREGVWKCGDCRKQFSVSVGTVMHRSHLTMRQWLLTFHLMCSSKKGISALQLQRELGLGSYRSALFLTHRIRLAMTEDPLMSKLGGKVEVDETYVGGKPRKGNNNKPAKRGRGTKKVPVMVMVERNGKAHARPVERVNGETLKGAIREMVEKDSTIYTDEWAAYQGIGQEFDGGHEVVNHSQGEYARGEANTNTAESYIALLKRGVTGIFHHVSTQQLHRYCNEFSFRWSNRQVDDSTRTENAIKCCDGKRLVYKIKAA